MKRPGAPEKFELQHEHCGVCGACLLNRDALHVCNVSPAVFMDGDSPNNDMWEVYAALTLQRPSLPTRHNDNGGN